MSLPFDTLALQVAVNLGVATRERCASIMTTTIVLLAVYFQERRAGPKSSNFPRVRMHWPTRMASLSNKQFLRRYRMDKVIF